MIDDPMTPVMTALRKVLKAKNMSVTNEWLQNFCFTFLNYANLYMRAYLRFKVIRTIAKAGLAINVFGGKFPGPSDLTWKDEKWIIADEGSTFGKNLEVPADSQISLNIGMFPGGLHDRLISGMLNGAVVLTDPSTYYHKNFVDGEDSLTFDWKHLDELPEKIVKLLSDEDRMQNMANLGRKKALENHTWKHRAEKIIEQVQLYKILNGI